MAGVHRLGMLLRLLLLAGGMLLASGLLLTGGRLLAADGPFDPGDALKQNASGVAPPVVVSADHALIESWTPSDLLHLHGLTPGVGVVLLALAVIPLFAGWRFLRLALALLCGSFLAMTAWQYGMPVLHAWWPTEAVQTLEPALVLAAALAFTLGLLLGWFLYQFEVALATALLGAMVLSLPGIYLAWPMLTWSLALVGLALGFLAGWVVAPYWAALQTCILGGALVVQGLAILVQDRLPPEHLRLVCYAFGIAAGVVGLMVQITGIRNRREHTTGARMAGGRPLHA